MRMTIRNRRRSHVKWRWWWPWWEDEEHCSRGGRGIHCEIQCENNSIFAKVSLGNLMVCTKTHTHVRSSSVLVFSSFEWKRYRMQNRTSSGSRCKNVIKDLKFLTPVRDRHESSRSPLICLQCWMSILASPRWLSWCRGKVRMPMLTSTEQIQHYWKNCRSAWRLCKSTQLSNISWGWRRFQIGHSICNTYILSILCDTIKK